MRATRWAIVLALFIIESVRAGDNVWTRLGQPSAAVTTLATDPQNAGTVYAATGAGLFKTVDEGVTWSALSPDPASGLVTLLIDTPTAATLYAGSQAGTLLKSLVCD